jgi:tetratricopeptide (TPR) repeat protein
MRAPFADLVLLWYSTVAIPLFGTNDGEISIDTKSLLERNLTKYPQSSLFLYMKGKYYRSILRDLAGSIACYERAADCAMFIKEVKLISLYEIGWIHVHQLSYAKAIDCFDVLHLTAKWARWFSTYVCAVLHSANGNFESADYFCKEALKIMAGQKKHKNNPAEGFALKRTEYIKKNPIKTTTFPEMLVCELLYVWVCYPYMEEASLKKTLECNLIIFLFFGLLKLYLMIGSL